MIFSNKQQTSRLAPTVCGEHQTPQGLDPRSPRAQSGGRSSAQNGSEHARHAHRGPERAPKRVHNGLEIPRPPPTSGPNQNTVLLTCIAAVDTPLLLEERMCQRGWWGMRAISPPRPCWSVPCTPAEAWEPVLVMRAAGYAPCTCPTPSCWPMRATCRLGTPASPKRRTHRQTRVLGRLAEGWDTGRMAGNGLPRAHPSGS